MWFGDLVTMKWWNGIWLNEAFATFMEMKATEAQRPDWNRWTEFGLSRTAAFDTDALDSTRPIEFEVTSPSEAEGMFDILTYEKGGAVLRMLEQYLGEDVFRDGVRRYLTQHEYGNTETTDLWDAIETVAGDEPVRRIMDSWIFQGGHPLVSADLVDATTLRLSQERFRLSAAAVPDPGDVPGLGDTWVVPVVLTVGADGATRQERVLLDRPELDVDLGGAPDFVVVNAGGHGFYRVRYSAKLRDGLIGRGIAGLEVLERYGILDDAWASVVAGAATADEFLELARAYADEDDVAVWKRLAAALDELDRVLPDDRRADLAGRVRALAGPALRRVGFDAGDGDDDRRRELRGTLLKLAAVLGGDEEAIDHARRLRETELATPGSVDPALVAAAISVVAETGGQDDFETNLARYRAAATPQEEMRELYALARYHHHDLIDRLCELALTEIRTQNAPYVLRVALQNRTEGARVWDFVRRNWETINGRFPSNSIVRMIEGISALVDEQVAADVQAFFAEHRVPQGAKQVAQQLERQRAGVALRQRTASA
jgi:puromycin-sensitive aminopeptidase